MNEYLARYQVIKTQKQALSIVKAVWELEKEIENEPDFIALVESSLNQAINKAQSHYLSASAIKVINQHYFPCWSWYCDMEYQEIIELEPELEEDYFSFAAENSLHSTGLESLAEKLAFEMKTSRDWNELSLSYSLLFAETTSKQIENNLDKNTANFLSVLNHRSDNVFLHTQEEFEIDISSWQIAKANISYLDKLYQQATEQYDSAWNYAQNLNKAEFLALKQFVNNLNNSSSYVSK